jgi:hypothetical protein
MKISKLIKSLFIGIFLTIFINGCSVNDETKNSSSSSKILNDESQLLFAKSPVFNWKNKKVEVSFEDNFQNFISIEKLGYSLSENNLKQGIIIKLKIFDFEDNSVNINEIMIESFDLSKGINQFTIGYKDKTPYIIY